MNWKKELNLYGLPDKVITFLVFLVFLSSVTEIVGIGMFLPIFDSISGQEKPDGVLSYINNLLIQVGIEPSFLVLLLITFSMFLISKIMIYIVSYVKAYYHGKMIRDMRHELLKRYLSASSHYYDSIDMGHFVNNNISELGAAVNRVMIPINLIVAVFSAIDTGD
jgi:ABC-type multidrug transport system fused ATPase/permease subunit